MDAIKDPSNEPIFRGTVAQLVVTVLQDLDVRVVFGIPGIQNLELFDELASSLIDVVTTTEERAAAFMADGYARATGKIGVLVLIGGPGLTNALTGIAEASLDSSPTLVLVSSGNVFLDKRFQLHEIPQRNITRPLVKGYFEPRTLPETYTSLMEAVQLALQGERGPVVVEIPVDLAMMRGQCNLRMLEPKSAPPPNDEIINRIVESLVRSHSVGIYVGAGAIDATIELMEIAELLRAPVATTISGRGVFPEDHELSVGYGFGPSGSILAHSCFKRIETLLSIACKFGEVSTGSYGVRVPKSHIHIDINPASIGVNYEVSIACIADAKTALHRVLDRLPRNLRCASNSLQTKLTALRAREIKRREHISPARQHVSPNFVFHTLRTLMGRDDVLVTDSGNHQFWALSDYPVYMPRSFFVPADFQAMGFSVPCAIGAKIGSPDKRVVSVIGDGGFLMSGFECLTAVRLGLQITFVVFVDGEWGLISEAQQRGYRSRVSTKISNPDFENLAKSLGLGFEVIHHDEELEEKLERALTCEKACLVQVNIRYCESSRYVRGSAPQILERLPLGVKTRLACRWVKRFVFPVSTRKNLCRDLLSESGDPVIVSVQKDSV